MKVRIAVDSRREIIHPESASAAIHDLTEIPLLSRGAGSRACVQTRVAAGAISRIGVSASRVTANPSCIAPAKNRGHAPPSGNSSSPAVASLVSSRRTGHECPMRPSGRVFRENGLTSFDCGAGCCGRARSNGRSGRGSGRRRRTTLRALPGSRRRFADQQTPPPARANQTLPDRGCCGRRAPGACGARPGWADESIERLFLTRE